MSGSLWSKNNERVAEAVRSIMSLETVEGTVDGGVTLGRGEGERTIPKAAGMPVEPGDQVVVLRFGRKEVAAFSTTRVGEPEIVEGVGGSAVGDHHHDDRYYRKAEIDYWHRQSGSGGTGSEGFGRSTIIGSAIRATAVGYGAEATDSGATSLGFAARANADDALALGEYSDVDGARSTIIGSQTLTAEEDTAVIVTNKLVLKPHLEQQTGSDASGIFMQSPDESLWGIIFDDNGDLGVVDNAAVTTSYLVRRGGTGTIVGKGSSGSITGGTAYGNDSYATAYGTALGYLARANNTGGTAVGHNAKAGLGSAAIGRLSTALGEGSLAIGNDTHVPGARSIGINPANGSDLSVGDDDTFYVSARTMYLLPDTAYPGFATDKSSRIWLTSVNGTLGSFGVTNNDEPAYDGVAIIPAGGSAGQALVKSSSSDFDTEWSTVSGGGGTPGNDSVGEPQLNYGSATYSVEPGHSTSEGYLLGLHPTFGLRRYSIASALGSDSIKPFANVWSTYNPNSTPNQSTFVAVGGENVSLPEGRWGCLLMGSATLWRSVGSGEAHFGCRIGGAYAEDRNIAIDTAGYNGHREMRIFGVRDNIVIGSGGGAVDVQLVYRGGATTGTTYIRQALLVGFFWRIND